MPRTKEQQRIYNEQYASKNRDKILLQKKKYQSTPEIRERHKKYYKKRYQDNKEKINKQMRTYYQVNRDLYLWAKVKKRAKEDGIDFTIERSDIVIPEYCPFLGVKLTHELGKGQLQTNSSVDRIDSTKGYIKGNVQVISRLANTMKSNCSIEQLLTFAKGVIKLYENK